MDHAEEAGGQLAIAGSDGAVDLEMAEHALDGVALLVEGAVILDLQTADLSTGVTASIFRSARSVRMVSAP